MFHFFGFLFVIIVAVLVIGLSIIGSVLRTIFGGEKNTGPPPAANTPAGAIPTRATGSKPLPPGRKETPPGRRMRHESTGSSSPRTKENMWISRKSKNSPARLSHQAYPVLNAASPRRTPSSRQRTHRQGRPAPPPFSDATPAAHTADTRASHLRHRTPTAPSAPRLSHRHT